MDTRYANLVTALVATVSMALAAGPVAAERAAIKSKSQAVQQYYWYDGDARRTAVMLEPVAENPATQVFKTGAQRMTLPGGVTVRFHGNVTEAQVATWMERQGLADYSPVVSPHSWLIRTPAGIESLEIANRLHALDEIEYASPNWSRERRPR